MSPSTTAVRAGQLRRCSRSTSARLSPCSASIANRGWSVGLGWADVDHEGEDRRAHVIAGLGIGPHGLGDVELELAAVRALLLVHVGHGGDPVEDVADAGVAGELEALFTVEDRPPWASEPQNGITNGNVGGTGASSPS